MIRRTTTGEKARFVPSQTQLIENGKTIQSRRRRPNYCWCPERAMNDRNSRAGGGGSGEANQRSIGEMNDDVCCTASVEQMLLKVLQSQQNQVPKMLQQVIRFVQTRTDFGRKNDLSALQQTIDQFSISGTTASVGNSSNNLEVDNLCKPMSHLTCMTINGKVLGKETNDSEFLRGAKLIAPITHGMQRNNSNNIPIRQQIDTDGINHFGQTDPSQMTVQSAEDRGQSVHQKTNAAIQFDGRKELIHSGSMRSVRDDPSHWVTFGSDCSPSRSTNLTKVLPPLSTSGSTKPSSKIEVQSKDSKCTCSPLNRPGERTEPDEVVNGARVRDEQGNVLYSWSQTLGEAEVTIDLPLGVDRANQCRVFIRTHDLTVLVNQNGTWINKLNGQLQQAVRPDGSYWTLEANKRLHVTLEKMDARWWTAVLQGEPPIDRARLPRSVGLHELGNQEQQIVQQMIHKQQLQHYSH